MLYHLKRLWVCSRPLQICTVLFILGFGWKSVADAGVFGLPMPTWLGGGKVPASWLDRGGKIVEGAISTTERGIGVANQAVDIAGKVIQGAGDLVDGIIGGAADNPAKGTP